MGRKIPGKKHRGVKDPEKQRELRISSVKDKINAPPINPDDQDIPKSLERIIELKNKVKNGEYNQKRKRTKIVKEGARKYEKPIPQFRQGKQESDNHFLHRVNQVCQAVIKEAAFEKKYGVEVRRNPETGNVEEVVKRERDEVDIMLRKARKEQKQKGKKKKVSKKMDEKPKLTKAQKRKAKLQEKKQHKLESNIDEFEKYKDNVKFGEVTHAPPTLVLPKKVNKSILTPRPGLKDLHLKSMLNKKDHMTAKKQISSDVKIKKTANRIIDKKGKRKDLPNAMRRQLDRQQEEVIKAYKQLKVKKQS